MSVSDYKEKEPGEGVAYMDTGVEIMGAKIQRVDGYHT